MRDYSQDDPSLSVFQSKTSTLVVARLRSVANCFAICARKRDKDADLELIFYEGRTGSSNSSIR